MDTKFLYLRGPCSQPIEIRNLRDAISSNHIALFTKLRHVCDEKINHQPSLDNLLPRY